MNSYSKLNTEYGIDLFWIETIEKEQQHFANAFVSHAIGNGKGQQCNAFPFLEDQSTKKIPKRIKPSTDYKYLFYFFRNWCVAMLTCCECAIVSWCRLLGSRLLLDTLCHHLPPANHHISTCHSSARYPTQKIIWVKSRVEASWCKLGFGENKGEFWRKGHLASPCSWVFSMCLQKKANTKNTKTQISCKFISISCNNRPSQI